MNRQSNATSTKVTLYIFVSEHSFVPLKHQTCINHHRPRSEEIDLLKVKKLRFQRFHVESAGYALAAPHPLSRPNASAASKALSNLSCLGPGSCWDSWKILKDLESMWPSRVLSRKQDEVTWGIRHDETWWDMMRHCLECLAGRCSFAENT